MLRLTKPLLPSSLALVLLLSPALALAETVYTPKSNPREGRKPRPVGEAIGPDDDDAWGREQWFLERMGGPLTPEFYRRVVKEAEKERALYPRLFPRPGLNNHAAVVSGSWNNLGPTGATFEQNGVTLNVVDSGRARKILPDTALPGTVYYLTSDGGLWKTTNFTDASPTWTATTDTIGSTSGGAAAFGRITTGTNAVLYLGTGDPFDRGVGGFVTKSIDGATTWGAKVPGGGNVPLNTATSAATKVYDLKVDTSAVNDIVLVGTDDGVYRSIDGGANFAQVGAALFAGFRAWSLARTSAGWLVAVEDPGAGAGTIYLSTDQGATWAASANNGNIYAGAGRTTLAVGVPGDAAVYAYAATTGDTGQLDLFKSTDGGQTWAAVGLAGKTPGNALGDQKTMDLMHQQAFYNHMVLVDPTDPSRNTVYLGGSLASAKTTDGGVSWNIVSDWLSKGGLPYIHADFHAAASVTINGTTRLFIGTDGGLFTSTDGGATWDNSKNNGIVTHLIYSLAVQPSISGSALIGLQDNGTRIRRAGSTLYDQVEGGDGFGVGWAPGSGVSLQSYTYNQLRRATTSPVTDQTQFLHFVGGLPAQDKTNFYFVTPVLTPTAAADPSGQVFFTYGRNAAIYRSNSTGWTQIGAQGAGGLGASRAIRSVSHGLGIHPGDLNRIAGAANGGYVIITTDGGKTWTERLLGSNGGDGVPGWYGYNSNVAWATDQLLYASSEDSVDAGAAHVAKTVDGGANWTRADTGLPDLPVSKLVVDLGDGTGNTVYAATFLGVYRTTDGAATWTRFGAGLPQGRVSDIFVAPDDSFVRIGTWGRGVWEMVNVPTAGGVVISPPSILVYPGDTFAFAAQVTGGGTVNWSASAGTITTGGVYTAPDLPGGYTVTATNAADGTITATANVLVQAPAPVTITSQPADGIAAVGFSASFSVAATGSGTVASGYNLTYQWKKNGSAIAGATAPTYTTPATTLADNAAQLSCDVTGRTGTTSSTAATLVVQPVGSATVASLSPNLFLPDNPAPAVEADFPISGVVGKVGEVTVSLFIEHTFIGDQTITLLAPDGSSVVISNGAGSNGLTTSAPPPGAAFGTSCGNYLVLSDHGAASIDAQASPPAIVGTFRPSFPLAAFTGKQPNGTWKLTFLDGGPGDTGTFHCGIVSVKPLVASLDINVDNAVDVYDVLELLKRYGSTAAPDLAKADLTGDGAVDDADLTLLENGL